LASTKIPALPEDRVGDLIALYKHLHRHPELPFQEVETAGVMASRLSDLGFSVHEQVGVTGVVATFANGDGPVVALRSDMDGLPIAEETALDYASAATAVDDSGTAVPVMHACGHDIHMVSLLGAAEALTTNKSEWNGTLVVIFQPAEETAQGAIAMVKDGLFDLIPRPDVILGQHVGNRPAGTVSFTVGPAMAAADSLRVTITGRGAHGSRPEASIDPVLLASSIVVRLQSIVAREIAPTDIAVVTVGSFHAGIRENIIPSTAELKLNLRSLTPAVRTRLLGAVERIITAECAAAGVEMAPAIESIGSFPRLVNEPHPAAHTVEALRAHFGEECVLEVPPVTISEDFGVLGASAGIPSFFWFIGSTDPATYAAAADDDAVDGRIPANHSSLFAPQPRPTITTGIDALVAAFLAWSGPGSRDSPRTPP
jgi:amidohydrolase